MFKLNERAAYSPKRGRYVQVLKTSEIVTPKVVVNSKGLAFKARYVKNPFDGYDNLKYFKTKSEEDTVENLWKNDPLKMYINCVNFAVFCATSGLGICVKFFYEPTFSVEHRKVPLVLPRAEDLVLV
uniref:hypothetical protein n=1 Tax=Acinetobacter baumannii TaxID=470 RepID=UPI001C0766A2